MLRNILVPPLTPRLLAFVFTRSEISVENADFGKNEFKIRFLRHFLRSVRKTCIFGFTCTLSEFLD